MCFHRLFKARIPTQDPTASYIPWTILPTKMVSVQRVLICQRLRQPSTYGNKTFVLVSNRASMVKHFRCNWSCEIMRKNATKPHLHTTKKGNSLCPHPTNLNHTHFGWQTENHLLELNINFLHRQHDICFYHTRQTFNDSFRLPFQLPRRRKNNNQEQ